MIKFNNNQHRRGKKIKYINSFFDNAFCTNISITHIFATVFTMQIMILCIFVLPSKQNPTFRSRKNLTFLLSFIAKQSYIYDHRTKRTKYFVVCGTNKTLFCRSSCNTIRNFCETRISLFDLFCVIIFIFNF